MYYTFFTQRISKNIMLFAFRIQIKYNDELITQNYIKIRYLIKINCLILEKYL